MATTWLLNFEEVEKRSPASVPILQLSAVLAADDIFEQLLLVCAKEFGLLACTDELAFAEQLAALTDFSLIQREQTTARYSIHRMVQAVIWHGLTEAERQDWTQRAIAGLNAVFPDVTKFENWQICGRLVPHVQAIAKLTAATWSTTTWASLLNQAGYYLTEQGRYGAAETLYQRSLQIIEQQLGVDHPDTATSLNNLAHLYYSKRRYSEAEPWYLWAIAILFNHLEDDHPNTQMVWNNFQQFLEQVLQERRTRELSDHQLTQHLLEELAWN
ncbi:tetratricopeptide repeat protein [Leptolyngbyaceae cyanobacterium UHCC 1019]